MKTRVPAHTQSPCLQWTRIQFTRLNALDPQINLPMLSYFDNAVELSSTRRVGASASEARAEPERWGRGEPFQDLPPVIAALVPEHQRLDNGGQDETGSPSGVDYKPDDDPEKVVVLASQDSRSRLCPRSRVPLQLGWRQPG